MTATRAQEAVDAVGFWWHSIDFGNGLVSPGAKSAKVLGEELEALHLPDVTGKTVLDVGGWDGYFAFAAERRGAAEVTVLDHYVWSLDLPRQQAYWRECQAAGISPLPYELTEFWQPGTLPGKRGFDTARRLLGSQVRDAVADFAADDLSTFGQWDVVLFLGVLYHLRDPYDALKRLRALTTELAIIETHAIVVPGYEDTPMWRFYPGSELNADSSNWWGPNLSGLEACLKAVGFAETTVKRGAPADGATDYRAVVHARVAPEAHSGDARPLTGASAHGSQGHDTIARVPHNAPTSRSPARRQGEPLLTRLLSDGVLICPRCSVARLVVWDNELRCDNCDRRYPRRNGVVDFLEYSEASHRRGIAAPPDVVAGVIRALGLSDTPAMRATVADIYSRTFRRVRSPSLSAEISSFADRFGLDPRPRARPTASEVANNVRRRVLANRRVRARIERHYIDGPLPVDSELTRNVRITNVGRTSWASTGSHPLHVSYRWRTVAGEPSVERGERTRLPIGVEPGRTISLPVRIRTPQEPGDYALQVGLVRGTDEWLPEPELLVRVEVRANAAAPTLPTTFCRTNQEYDYAKDHEVGAALVRERIRLLPGDRTPRLLEVGGGPSPQIGPLSEIDGVNVDIVAPLLELGAVVYDAEHRHRLQFLCCDALEPPFADSSFDAVVMFSTLHHFPEPEVLLAKCAELITDDGFIAVLCEPVGDGLEQSVTVRDLLAGINEQVFSIEEYLELFDRAGLVIESGRLDGGSLKVFLRPLAAFRGRARL